MTVEKEEKIRSRNIRAYEMAKEIAENTETYYEAMLFIDQIRNNFETARSRRGPEVLPYPIDKWGQKIEMPDTKASGK